MSAKDLKESRVRQRARRLFRHCANSGEPISMELAEFIAGRVMPIELLQLTKEICAELMGSK